MRGAVEYGAVHWKKTYWFLINDREIIEKAIHESEQLKGVLGDIQEIDIARSYHSPRWEWTGKIKPHRYKRYTLEVKGSKGKAIVFAGKYADESGFSLSFLPRKEGISEHEL